MATTLHVELLEKHRRKPYEEFAHQPDSGEYFHLICSSSGIVVAVSSEEDATNLWDDFLAAHRGQSHEIDYVPEHCVIMPGRQPLSLDAAKSPSSPLPNRRERPARPAKPTSARHL